jgi:hypothetical protein
MASLCNKTLKQPIEQRHEKHQIHCTQNDPEPSPWVFGPDVGMRSDDFPVSPVMATETDVVRSASTDIVKTGQEGMVGSSKPSNGTQMVRWILDTQINTKAMATS